ncbi:MAG: P-type conjugative transfer protein TrbL [Mucispirillum sp.]|nr:P-type conjugative transfer protein TrbL [Mucispirillum sp.]
MNNELFINDIQNILREHLTEWTSILQEYGTNLFMIMATIALIVNIILIVTESAGGIDTNRILGFLIRFSFVTGFFYYILMNGTDFASKIINSFIELGQDALSYGYSQNTADKVLSAGFKIMESVWEAAKSMNITEKIAALPLYAIAIIIFIILILILGNYIVEIASAWILIFGAYFVLAFGATQWTREWVINYFKAIFAVGLKILTLMFLISIGVELIDKQVSIIDGGQITFNSSIAILATTLLLYMVMNKAPDAVAALVSGAWGHMSAINMASAVAALGTATVALSTATSMVSKIGGAGLDSAKNFVAGAKDYMDEQKAKTSSALDQNNTFTDWNNDKQSYFGNNDEQKRSGSGLSYRLGRGAGRIGNVLGGKMYGDDSGEDKTYNANRPPIDKPDNDIGNNDNNSGNDKPNDTKENN